MATGKGVKQKAVSPKTIAVGSDEEAHYLQLLNEDFKDNDMNFMTASDDPFLASDSDDPVSVAQDMYKQKMIMACISPLMKGVNSDSIIASVGMYIGISMVSKDFQKDFKDALSDTVTSFRLNNVEGKLDKEIKKHGVGTNKYNKLENKRDKLVMKQNHGHMPFTAKTAAMTQLRFTRQAYNAMRKPGADIEGISEQYERSISMLYSRAERDGVSAGSLDKSARTMVGQLIQNDPNNAMYFSELSYNNIKRSDFTTNSRQVMGVNGVKTVSETTWQGEFESPDGKPFRGSFTPRKPMSMTNHCEAYEKHIEKVLSDEGCNSVDAIVPALKKGYVNERMDFIANMMHEDGYDPRESQQVLKDAAFHSVDKYTKMNFNGYSEGKENSENANSRHRNDPVDAPSFDDVDYDNECDY